MHRIDKINFFFRFYPGHWHHIDEIPLFQDLILLQLLLLLVVLVVLEQVVLLCERGPFGHILNGPMDNRTPRQHDRGAERARDPGLQGQGLSGPDHRVVQGRQEGEDDAGGPGLAPNYAPGRQPLLPAGGPVQEGAGRRGLLVRRVQRLGRRKEQERHSGHRL